MTIQEKLFSMQDTKYREFHAKLIPNVDPDTIIGVRTPALRSFARELSRTDAVADFLSELPHRYYDENQLHAFLISGIKDYDAVIEELERFLPHVNNWATCDQTSPKIFKKHLDRLIGKIREWIASGETYTVRFGIGMMMQFYLDEAFQPGYLKEIAAIRSGEYYVNMMIAWFFATALAKQYDAAILYLEQEKLEPWVHNKTIQKARESRRITPEQKIYLTSLKKSQNSLDK